MIRTYLAGIAAARDHSESTEIEGRLTELVARFLAANGVERQALTLEYMRLQEALEDARHREHSNP